MDTPLITSLLLIKHFKEVNVYFKGIPFFLSFLLNPYNF